MVKRSGAYSGVYAGDLMVKRNIETESRYDSHDVFWQVLFNYVQLSVCKLASGALYRFALVNADAIAALGIPNADTRSRRQLPCSPIFGVT